MRLLELSRTHFDILALDWWFVQAGRRQAVAMPPGKTGVSVRKTARYAGNKRGRLHDTKHHVTINAAGGDKDASVFFGAAHGSTHTINFDQAALLDAPKNAGGMTSADLVGHETLEGYAQSKGDSYMDSHNWANDLGFSGMSPVAGGTYAVQNGMVIGMTFNSQIQGTKTIESITTRFVTPIPQAEFLKNAKSQNPTPSPVYPVSVEKK